MINISDSLHQQDLKQSQEYLKALTGFMKEDSMNYWIGNPSVQIISGSLFLQKYNLPKDTRTIEGYIRQLKDMNSISSTCLIIVGIPTCVRPLELWESLADTQEFIQECRVVKIQEPGFYSLLVRLKSEEFCEEFYNFNFGRRINQLEHHLILFREIASITIQFDQFVISERTELQVFRRKKTNEIHAVDPVNIFMTYTIDKSSPTASFICAICFEDMMNSNQGVLSILCGHYFHESCLSKWNEPTCPLCRYHQQPPTLSFCEACNNNQNLWLCLVCGKKLCSGDQQILQSPSSHIYQHFKETQHAISMEIESKFIYEFSLKDFLHRVYFNEKTREPSAGIQPKFKKSKDIIKEYQNVTMIEMEEQRKYFQKKIAEDKKRQREEIQNILNQISHLKEENQKLVTEYDPEKEQKSLQQLESEFKTSEKYHTLLTLKLKSMDSKVSKVNEKEEAEVKRLSNEIIDKRQEIKDIQQNIAASKKIKKKLDGQKISMEYFVKK